MAAQSTVCFDNNVDPIIEAFSEFSLTEILLRLRIATWCLQLYLNRALIELTAAEYSAKSLRSRWSRVGTLWKMRGYTSCGGITALRMVESDQFFDFMTLNTCNSLLEAKATHLEIKFPYLTLLLDKMRTLSSCLLVCKIRNIGSFESVGSKIAVCMDAA